MLKTSRVLLGFIFAPSIPALALYLYGVFMGFGTSAIVGPLILMPLGYLVEIVFGIPVFLVLKKYRMFSLLAYCLSGIGIGLLGYIVFEVLPSYSRDMFSAFRGSFGAAIVSVVYSWVAAAVFSLVAIRKPSDS